MADNLQQKLQSIIDKINTKTKKDDTNLTGAVKTLMSSSGDRFGISWQWDFNHNMTPLQEWSAINYPLSVGEMCQVNFNDFTEFTRVEYIESTGTQYINTEYVFNEKTKIEIDMQYISGYGWFGNFESGKQLLFGINSQNKWNAYYNSTEALYGTKDTQRHTITINDNGKWYIDTTLIATYTQGFSSTNSTPYYLFATYRSSSQINDGVNWKVYSIKMYGDDGTPVRDFVPCYHTRTGIIGLFDMINNKFYTNAGTGTFNKGNDINTEDKDVGEEE